jgi:CelD/BcsL family acetyltransferase involved in cellulose biosynthesis
MQNTTALEPPAPSAPATAARRSVAPVAPEPFARTIDRQRRALAGVWQAWRELTREAPPLLSPELAILATRLMDASEHVLFGARRGDTLVAALPLSRCRSRHGRTLVAVRNDHTPRFDLVGDMAALPELWHAVRDTGGWDVLELRGVPADSPLAVALPQLVRKDGFAVRVRETHRAPWFLIDGIEQRINRRFRGDMRRLERQLGGVQLERVSAFDAAALRDVLRLEAAAWKGAAGTAIACDARVARFYEGLARVFAAKGRLTLAFLRARGERIAGLYALEDATTFYLMKTGYDPQYAHFGPGQLLVRETALDAGRRGLLRYDMLGRDTPWKMKWTDQARAHVAVDIYAPSARGRMHYFLREFARPLAGRTLRALRPFRP